MKMFHSVILKKERRPKSVSIKWNQATSLRGQRQVKLHILNDREREERRDHSRGMHPNSGKTVYTSAGRDVLDHGGISTERNYN